MTIQGLPTPREFFHTRLDGLLAERFDDELLAHGVRVRSALSTSDDPDVDDADLDRVDDVLRHATQLSLARHLVADRYDSMGEFWDQVRLQEDGRSAGTYWDSYEHGGRRRVERRLADAYGSPAALLVNSGMSAIYCALRVLGRRADGVVVHNHAYFETTQLYDLLGPDMPIYRCDLTPTEVTTVRGRTRSTETVLVAETATNAPQAHTVPLEDDSLSGTTILLDNSVLGHGLNYRALKLELPSARLVVVESGSKYLCSMASIGVVYGEKDDIEEIRLWARRTGQQLQAPAFAHLHPIDIELASTRAGLHGRAAAAFADALSPDHWRVRLVGHQQAPAGLRKLVREHGPGALVFLEPLRPTDLDAVVDEWTAASRSTPRRVRVQAGFGWSWTSTRAYSSLTLNQPDAPRYVRVSVGLLTERAAAEQARLFNEVATNTRLRS
ncbi:hypothetical protein Acsp06_62530 [Actinomycetospora sp. NBRC 106375]|uniref:PLP-dependent transferase n=1 Tax=Actinomycetospora sp. NBRC 106375 TaxID=3032207 RepID=UPI0024A36D2A|nr:PLP-dependent transferase [Actinomycetospora sp. NBRC 106375]GLZ50068.1 hypothetical protein Acsp06_62530 [Actinomycetospora sp. NBRC 106375]